MACAAAPCSVATSATAAARSPASRSARACASTPAAGSPISTRSPWRTVTRSCAWTHRRVSSGWPSLPDGRPPAPRARPGETPGAMRLRWAERRRQTARAPAARRAGRRAFGRRPGPAAAWTADATRRSTARRSGSCSLDRREAAFDRVQPAGQVGLRGPAGVLQCGRVLASSGARFGGCRCSSAARRLSSGARSGAGAARRLAAAGVAPERSPGHSSGPRSGICGCGRCSSRVTRASSAPSWCARASVCSADGRRNGGMPPDPDQRGRQDQESGDGQPGKQERRRAGSAAGGAGGSAAGSGGWAVSSLIAAARASRPGSAERRRGSAARGAPVMPRRRAGR